MAMDTCTAKGRRAAAAAVLVLGVAGVLAGCSSDGGSKAGAAAPTASSPARTPAQAAPAPATSVPDAVVPTATPSAQPAGNRPADPCSVLTNDQVTGALAASTPLRAEGASTEEAWGCTWGSRQSYVSIKELDAARFTAVTAGSQSASSPLPGIGDDAVLVKNKEDGRMPKVVFTVAGHHYSIEAVADRSELGAVNAAREAAVEQQLAATAAKALAG
ncbi:hypothetical protein PUR71_09290 [Streptomyces sp. SP17BM10]|uniref:hypothetical protein n=1 Tax=Streptomyces sp. SP17BM10 TaxID=3002530 RepID=UPI002E7A7FD2|nr:hypothetical protein [Streptomyces sp. SP17BM10]MEE1783109.1 hypothetical protein [Streptomyces sp. SP17BM10]